MLPPLFLKELWVIQAIWIRIHNPDSSHNTSESVDLTNLDSTDYGCEIRLMKSSHALNKIAVWRANTSILGASYVCKLLGASRFGRDLHAYHMNHTC